MRSNVLIAEVAAVDDGPADSCPERLCLRHEVADAAILVEFAGRRRAPGPDGSAVFPDHEGLQDLALELEGCFDRFRIGT